MLTSQYSEIVALHDEIFGHTVHSDVKIWDKLAPYVVFIPKAGFLAIVHTGDYYHIWLCGVKKEYRQLGLFQKMLAQFFDDYDGVGIITLCIYPKKSPKIYDWADKRALYAKRVAPGKVKFWLFRQWIQEPNLAKL